MARTLLLEVAAAAVLAQDQARLGDTLMLLGEVAINQQELSAAEIYLQEALYLAMSEDNVLATARCYQLLGRLNIRARELARHAANTYDRLWQARNSIARGQYRGVADSLQAVIDENLEIRRYGAAADAWEAVASLHDRVYDGYQAQQARIEAARLFASIGQMMHVRRLIDGLDHSLIGDSELAAVEDEMRRLFEQHEQELVTASQARDYQMLYHHYLRLGQLERAWNFRIKASETLAETGDRAMYRRQTDVIAVLYNSNFAIDRAKKYLDRAGSLYRDGGAEEMLAETRNMESLIY
jgi:flagellin-specific chaperone FliS